MKERPILFSAPMVRAILAGTKTQTRRVVKPRKGEEVDPSGIYDLHPGDREIARCPYGHPGDLLWVREAWRTLRRFDGQTIATMPRDSWIAYEADENQGDALPKDAGGRMGKVRPSIHMPRWASRITLEIVSVRVERLQEISEADAVAEGVTRQMRSMLGWSAEESEEAFNARQARSTFGLLWESINGPGSWASNPYVWAVEFRRVMP
jgi:hypothetical protein